MSHPFDDIVLTAPVSFAYSRSSEHGVPWFVGRTLALMLDAAGLDKASVDGLAIASFSLPPDTPVSLAQSLGLDLRLLESLPFGGASGVIAAKRAARAIQAGDAEVIACIGADTLNSTGFGELVANFSGATQDASFPYGGAGPNLPFAFLTQAYADRYDVSREDFAQICLQQRYNANHYAPALLGRKPLSLDDYLDAPAIVEPLHLFDCVMPCAGADGFLVMHIDRARALNLDYAHLRSAFESFNAFPDDPIQMRAGWSRYGDALYEQAGLSPNDVDVIETYDDYPVVVCLQLEGMQFSDPGEAPFWVAANDLRFDTPGPAHNTSGGQLSVGQAGAAGGFLGIVEALRQLCGAAEKNQVRDASCALVTGFGMINYDRGLCSSAAILVASND